MSMKLKTPRKKDAEIPELEGWTFFPLTTNLYLFCQMCRNRPGEMFYRSVQVDGSPTFRTEAICIPCSKKLNSLDKNK